MAKVPEALFRPSEYVQKAFKKAEEGLDAITDVQEDNRIKIPSVQPALSLLDLHEVSRTQIHLDLFQRLREKLEHRLELLDDKGVRKLLEKSFRFVTVPELRGVVMSLVEALPQPVDERYLVEIAEKEELYSECPTAVKQQIWQINPGVFGEAVSPLLDQYIAHKESILFATVTSDNAPSAFLSLPAKIRRQNSVLQQLIKMLGSSVPLYNLLCQFLRTLYLRTHVSHYCTLRADLIMLLHEQDNIIMDSDRCHKFAWCLDASIRAATIDEKKLKELYNFLDTIEGGDEVLEDVSMFLRDPYALHTISKTVLQTLQKMATEQKLPRENKYLESLLRLLSIGVKSLTYLEQKSYSGDPLEADLVVRFLPELVSIMTEPSLRGIYLKLKLDYTPLEPSHSFITQMSCSQEAMLLSCTYSLQLLEKKDFRTLSLLLPAIAKAYVAAESDMMPDGYLHSLVVMLVPHITSLREPQLVSIMKEFWVVCSQHSETGLLYCCRFLWACHDKIKPAYFVLDILQSISPSQEMSEVAHQQYNVLLEHIQPSPDASP